MEQSSAQFKLSNASMDRNDRSSSLTTDRTNSGEPNDHRREFSAFSRTPSPQIPSALPSPQLSSSQRKHMVPQTFETLLILIKACKRCSFSFRTKRESVGDEFCTKECRVCHQWFMKPSVSSDHVLLRPSLQSGANSATIANAASHSLLDKATPLRVQPPRMMSERVPSNRGNLQALVSPAALAQLPKANSTAGTPSPTSTEAVLLKRVQSGGGLSLLDTVGAVGAVGMAGVGSTGHVPVPADSPKDYTVRSKGDLLACGDILKGDSPKGDSIKGDGIKEDCLKGDSIKGDCPKADSIKGDSVRSKGSGRSPLCTARSLEAKSPATVPAMPGVPVAAEKPTPPIGRIHQHRHSPPTPTAGAASGGSDSGLSPASGTDVPMDSYTTAKPPSGGPSRPTGRPHSLRIQEKNDSFRSSDCDEINACQTWSDRCSETNDSPGKLEWALESTLQNISQKYDHPKTTLESSSQKATQKSSLKSTEFASTCSQSEDRGLGVDRSKSGLFPEGVGRGLWGVSGGSLQSTPVQPLAALMEWIGFTSPKQQATTSAARRARSHQLHHYY